MGAGWWLHMHAYIYNFKSQMRPKKLMPERKGLGGVDLKQVSNKMVRIVSTQEEKLNQLKSLMQKQKQDREYEHSKAD